MIEVRFIESDIERESAFKIASSIFSAEDMGQKRMLWDTLPYQSHREVIAIFVDGMMIGLMRAIPTTIFLGEQYYKSAALSSICVLPQRQKQGHSSILMKESLKLLKNEGYQTAHLVARRAVDYYYQKFGFFGISSYERLTLESLSYFDDQVELNDTTSQEIEFLNSCYNECYDKCSGKTQRSLEYWKFAINRARAQGCQVKTFFKKNEALGYIVFNDNHVHEIGYKRNLSFSSIASSLPFVKNKCSVDIPFSHHLIQKVPISADISYSFRSCPFGGHMLADLSNLSGDLSSLCANIAQKYKVSVGTNRINSFNLSLLDQL